MGATFDMNKLRDAHQARTLRLLAAAHQAISSDDVPAEPETVLESIAATLMELATIWREEAQALIDAEKKKQGWKGTSDKLFQSASDVAGVAVAIRNHGLPAGPITVIDAGQNGGIGYIIDPQESITPVAPEEFTGEREPGPKAQVTTAGVSTPENIAAQTAPQEVLFAEMPTLSQIQSAANANPGKSLEEIHAIAKAEAYPKGEPSPFIPDASTVPPTNGISPVASPKASDDPAGDFLRDLGKDPSQGDWAKVSGAIAPEVNSNGELTGVGIVSKSVALLPFDFASLSIGVAAAPPSWTQQPPAIVYELSDDPATWLPSPDHTSVSQANLAGQCSLKWWLSKRRGASERPGWSLVGGKALHSVIELIEELLHQGMRFEAMDTGWVATKWRECFDGAILDQEELTPDWPRATWHAASRGKEDESWWRADGPEMVHRYLEWRERWVAQGWQLLRLSDGRVAIEHEFLAFIGGNVVKGYIDSIWVNVGRQLTAIVDWKSGSTMPPDYFQQAAYAIAVENIIPAWPVAGAFWDARKGELTGPLINLPERHPRAEVEMRLSGPRRIDAAGLYIPNVEGGYGGCNSCSLKRSCPVGSRMGKGEIT